jgi:hypothetical protein
MLKTNMKAMKAIKLALLSTSTLLLAYNASASTSNVAGAVINEGQHQIQARVSYTLDDNNSRDKFLRSFFFYDYGVNDWFALRLVTAANKPNNDSYENNAVSGEARFQVFERDQDGFDAGFRFIYDNADGDKKPDAVKISTHFNDIYEKYSFINHNVFEHETGSGSNDGIKIQTRWQVTRAIPIDETYILNPLTHEYNLTVGLEMFNRFGNMRELNGYDNQSHVIGPVFKGHLIDDIFFQTGYQVGISENAPDHAFKLFLSRKF